MPVFIDTSAIYAALTVEDAFHEAALAGWASLKDRREVLQTSNYVLLESIALLARRLGIAAVREFQRDFVPLLEVSWVDEEIHSRAMSGLLAAGRRDLSLVDCVSFELMRVLNLKTAFAFDAHFAEQGFQSIP